MRLVLYADGAARGNPGPAGAGARVAPQAIHRGMEQHRFQIGVKRLFARPVDRLEALVHLHAGVLKTVLGAGALELAAAHDPADERLTAGREKRLPGLEVESSLREDRGSLRRGHRSISWGAGWKGSIY